MDPYDIIVIGGGAAGHHAAARAGQLGLRVMCVERGPDLGGSAMVTGCLPSKALLHASQVYEAARDGDRAAIGVEGAPILNLACMMACKTKSVTATALGIEALFARHQVARLAGEARLAGPGQVVVRLPGGGDRMLRARDIVIATGSRPLALAGAPFDHVRIIDAADALALAHVPARLAIVGAGAAGLEIGSIWRRLGAQVTLIERGERICPWLDREVAEALRRILERQGLAFRLSTRVAGIRPRGAGVRLHLDAPSRGGPGILDADLAMVAIGRRAAVGSLNLESVGLRPDAQGALPHLEHGTGAPGVWVAGDATTGPMLAHKAAEEGIACAELIAGLPGHVDHASMPRALYTRPEVAMVGRTEEELRAAGIGFKVGRAAFAANARARIHGETEGFVKLLVDAGSDLLLGAHLIGPGVGDMIGALSLAMEASVICEDLARTCHPQPTRAEALRQAAMDAGGWRMQT